ncbi:MAG: serine/threonine protein kinase [Myxococcaceae bacterium]|nr:serine/threonine protein kinase [Myxococcaceae bacterium]MCA3016980.1 serine/threonine protein kinase [Myxococcaceae bacterium]
MGIRFGRYELLRKIAAGGMGQVLLARKGAEGFEKLVVIKRILPHLVEDEEFFTMFVDEAKITMRLDHPNIARINEFGVEGGVHFIEMEYVAGEDVRRLDKRARVTGKALPLGVVLRIIADAAAGLDFAHKAKDAKGEPLNLVHRDVSPQNVLVGFDGAVKLIDFGVAKAAGRAQHTATGILKGKFPYMSPEQADGYDLDARSDVFALGIVLWELLTGKRLFKGENDLMTQRLVKACQVPPPSQVDPSVPAALDEVVLRALAKAPGDRYADAGAFRMALEDFALAEKIPASNAHLVAFMQALYAERIAKEADPRSLEEDSGLTGLDAGGLQLNAQGPTTIEKRAGGGPVPVQHSGQTGKHHTEAVPTPQRRRVGLWLGLGAGGLVAVVVAGVLLRGTGPGAPRQPSTPPLEKPPEVVTPAVPPPEPVRVEPAPAPIEYATFSLTSEPEGAEVSVGGEKKGLTPLEVKVEKTKLPMLLEVSREGYEPYQATLSDATGAALTAALKKKAPVGGKVGPRPSDIKTTR